MQVVTFLCASGKNHLHACFRVVYGAPWPGAVTSLDVMKLPLSPKQERKQMREEDRIRRFVDYTQNQKIGWRKIRSGPKGPMVMQLA